MEKMLRNLLLTAKEIRLHLEEELSTAGGSLSTWLVLHAIEDSESEGSSQTQLATHINIEGPTLTRHLDRLEASDLIERRSDSKDRRITRIYASPAGRRLYDDLLAVVRRFEENLVQGLTAEQVVSFNRLLDQIETNLTHRNNDRPK